VGPPGDVDALLIGSANAIRHAGPGLAAYAGLPTYTVGAATAQAAREAGLDVVAVGSGGLQPVLDTVTHTNLLRLAGQEHLTLTPPPHVRMVERSSMLPRPCPCLGSPRG
jgi:uroporphyrinogen-III synthase